MNISEELTLRIQTVETHSQAAVAALKAARITLKSLTKSGTATEAEIVVAQSNLVAAIAIEEAACELTRRAYKEKNDYVCGLADFE